MMKYRKGDFVRLNKKEIGYILGELFIIGLIYLIIFIFLYG